MIEKQHRDGAETARAIRAFLATFDGRDAFRQRAMRFRERIYSKIYRGERKLYSEWIDATTVEVVVREGQPSLLVKGAVVVPSHQIAKLRQVLATIAVTDCRIVKLRAIVAAIEGSAL